MTKEPCFRSVNKVTGKKIVFFDRTTAVMTTITEAKRSGNVHWLYDLVGKRVHRVFNERGEPHD